MTDFSDPTMTDLIRSALLWDVPRLLMSDSPDARQFLEALGHRSRLKEEAASDHPLSLAARSVKLALAGDIDAAVAVLAPLEDSEGLTEVLGRAIHAWISPDYIGSFATFLAATALPTLQGEDDELRASLWMRLVGFALDHGLRAEAQGYLRTARSVVPLDRPQLASELAVLAFNEFQEPFELSPHGPDLSEPLTELPWIDESVSGDAIDIIKDHLKSQAQSAWASNFKLGRIPADGLYWAALQSEWAGARWRVPRLRSAIAATLLVTGTGRISRAVALGWWALFDGAELGSIVATTEAYLSSADIDFMWRHVFLFGRTFRTSRSLATAVNATWDLISIDVATRIIENVVPNTSALGVQDPVNQAFARLAGLIPAVWISRFQGLAAEVQDSVVRCMVPIEAELVGHYDLTGALGAAVARLISDDPVPVNVGAIARLLGVSLDNVWHLEDLSPSQLFDVAQGIDTVRVPDELIRDAISRVAAELDAVIENVKQGRFSIPARSPWMLYAIGAGLLNSVNDKQILPLSRAMNDSALPTGIRVEAVMALLQLSLTVDLAPWVTEYPQTAEDGPPEPFVPLLVAASPSEFASFVWLLQASISADEDDTLAILAASIRSGDARIRELTVNVIRKKLSGSRSFELLLLSALYDPVDAVVVRGLLAASHGYQPLLSQAFERRAAELYRQGSSAVRGAVAVYAQSRLEEEGPSVLADIVSLAQNDKSRFVRSAIESS